MIVNNKSRSTRDLDLCHDRRSEPGSEPWVPLLNPDTALSNCLYDVILTMQPIGSSITCMMARPAPVASRRASRPQTGRGPCLLVRMQRTSNSCTHSNGHQSTRPPPRCTKQRFSCHNFVGRPPAYLGRVSSSLR